MPHCGDCAGTLLDRNGRSIYEYFQRKEVPDMNEKITAHPQKEEREEASGKIPSKMAPRSIRRRVRTLRSSFRCLFSKIFLRFSSCRISFRTSSRSSFCVWAVIFSFTPAQAGKSIHAALRRLRRYFVRQKWTVNL